MRDYQLASPSLEGIIRHGSTTYGGVQRPEAVIRIMDGPSSRGATKSKNTKLVPEEQHHIIEQYFHDLYGVFMKKLSHFIVDADPGSEATLMLQAMLQEMIKIKNLMARNHQS